MKVGEAVVEIVGDPKKLDKSLKDSHNRVKSSMQKMQKAMLPVGAAFTAIGVAGLAMIQSTKKINAALGVTALNLGITTKEMRELTLATTNVTFPISEVTATFDLLARAGVDNIEIMKSVATTFDTLGDALGVPASVVTAQLIPAMKTFNISATEMAGKTDALTWLFRNTTVNLEDFNRMVGYTTPELVAMGLTTEDMIAILAELEEQGYSGEVMTREFRKAVTNATKEQIPLNEALGISTEKIEGYKTEMEGAVGLTQEFADIANEQYTIMDKLKQKWEELTLMASEYLEPLEPILAGMTALGPLMIGLSMVGIPRLIIAVKALGHALKTLLLNPIVLLIAALGALGYATYSLIQHDIAANKMNEARAKIVDELAKSEGKLTEGVLLAHKAYNELALASGLLSDEQEESISKTQEIIALWEDGTYVINEATGALELYTEATKESTKETDKAITKQRELFGLLAKAVEAKESLVAIQMAQATMEGKWGLLRTLEAAAKGVSVEELLTVRPKHLFPGYYPPELQGGGIISKPTLAMLGERGPEAVVPLDRMGGYKTANIYLMMDSRVLGRALGRPLVDEIYLKTGLKI